MSPDHSAGTKAALRLRQLQRNLSSADVSVANADWVDAVHSFTQSLKSLPPSPEGQRTQPAELPAAWKLEVRNDFNFHLRVANILSLCARGVVSLPFLPFPIPFHFVVNVCAV